MRKKIAMVVLACSVIVGSQAILFASTAEPGTSSDPVITESYFTTNVATINNKVSTLESKTTTNTSDVSALKNQIAALEAKVNTLTGTSSGLKQEDVNVLLHLSGMNPSKKYGAVNTTDAKLKAEASDSATDILTLPYFAGLDLIDAKDGYIKVKYYNHIGWVKSTDIDPHFLK